MGTIGRVALVTGAGRGLGAEIARALADAGHLVAVNDLPGASGADAVVDSIRAAGRTAVFVPADVTDEADVSELAQEVERRFGAVDTLVVNATGAQPVIPVEDLSWSDMLDHLLLFVKSPLLLVQAVLPMMKQQARGRIVMIGSDMFERAVPGMSAYSSAKGAQLGLTRTWARELGRFGVTVNLVAPGWVPVERHADVPAAELDAYRAAVPLGRLGRPADVASVVVFLASDAAGFVTGERIAVNGGHLLT